MSNLSVFRVFCCTCPQRFTSGSLYTSRVHVSGKVPVSPSAFQLYGLWHIQFDSLPTLQIKWGPSNMLKLFVEKVLALSQKFTFWGF